MKLINAINNGDYEYKEDSLFGRRELIIRLKDDIAKTYSKYSGLTEEQVREVYGSVCIQPGYDDYLEILEELERILDLINHVNEIGKW